MNIYMDIKSQISQCRKWKDKSRGYSSKGTQFDSEHLHFAFSETIPLVVWSTTGTLYTIDLFIYYIHSSKQRNAYLLYFDIYERQEHFGNRKGLGMYINSLQMMITGVKVIKTSRDKLSVSITPASRRCIVSVVEDALSTCHVNDVAVRGDSVEKCWYCICVEPLSHLLVLMPESR